ncbi:MAG TPA: Mu-like prophage major head subunit gpT family protein [Beijerinckiaceae bacterium]|nr:Mu-like prophage major head subunit gpT family protein [Beijerinckiaceae bacterium]
MIINRGNLTGLTTGFRTNFQNAFDGVTPTWPRVATLVSSNTAAEEYPWLGAFPRMRKWVGDRVVKNLAANGYRIVNEKFEDTVGVKRDSIEDDQFGVYKPMFEGLGRAVAEFPDELVYAKLAKGFTENCYDGQFFFDTDHPVINPATGQAESVSNMQAGVGAPWFLLDTTKAMRPLILQERQKARFTSLDNPNDDHVFKKDEFIYGADCRYGVGFGFWQMAFGSKAALSTANFDAARLAMENVKSDEGVKLGIRPTLLVIGSSNEAAAEAILLKQNLAGGESNVNYKRVEILKVSWLD